MDKRIILVGVCLVSIGLGYCLNLALNYFPSIMASDHYEVAKQILVYDVSVQRDLVLKYEGSGSVSPLAFASLEIWSQGKTYPISRWGFYSGNDLNAYMLVTGPGNDGETYGCEIVRMAWNELTVTTPNGEYTFPRLTQGGVQQGYLSIEFIP